MVMCQARIADDRKAVQQADHVGLPLKTDGCPGGRTQLLSAEFIAEALTISDLFELNEVAAVELLLAGDVTCSVWLVWSELVGLGLDVCTMMGTVGIPWNARMWV